MRKKRTPNWGEFFDGGLGNAIWRLPEHGIEFDERTLEVRRGGQLLAIEAKPLYVLMALIRRPQQLVLAEQLAEAIWCGQIISDSVLVQAVSKLRMALMDPKRQLIQTVHGRGYRLAAQPERLLISTSDAAAESLPKIPGLRVLRPSPARPGLYQAACRDSGEPRWLRVAGSASSLATLRREQEFYQQLPPASLAASLMVPPLASQLSTPPYYLLRAAEPGMTLPNWVTARGGFECWPLVERCALLCTIAAVIADLHQLGLHLSGSFNPHQILVDAVQGPGRVWLVPEFDPASVCTGLTPASGRYRMPECDETGGNPFAADLYSLGLLALHLCSGRWTTGLAPGWEQTVPDLTLQELITGMLHLEAPKRLPSAGVFLQRLAQHPLLLGRCTAAHSRPLRSLAPPANDDGTLPTRDEKVLDH